MKLLWFAVRYAVRPSVRRLSVDKIVT